MQGFDFVTLIRIIFGRGTLQQIGEIAKPFGKKVMIFHGSGSVNIEPTLELLRKSGISYVCYKVSGEPSITLVEQAVIIARESQIEFVIGLGGGSVLDTAKAVSAMLRNPGELLDYLETVGRNQPLLYEAIPFIAIPTTAGTGTEVTKNSVLSVDEKKIKVSLRSQLIIPKIALVDPELTLSVPRQVTASSGFDALTQLIESFISKRANRMTDILCVEGIGKIGKSLMRCYCDGNDIEAREKMAWGSLLGGITLTNAGLGAVHAFANPIGGEFQIPHGIICARLLPVVMEYTIKKLRIDNGTTLEKINLIAELLSDNGKSDLEQLIRKFYEMRDGMGIPPLKNYGMSPENSKANLMKAKNANSMKTNPIFFKDDELELILEKAIG